VPGRIDLAGLSTFLAVMEAGGVSHAARRLGIARSVVSKRVAALEAALATPLFVRSSVGMVPTEAAERLHGEAARLLRELDDAANRLRPPESGLCGRLRVTAPLSLTLGWLSAVFVDFARVHPDLDLQLELDDRITDLVNGGFDAALRVGPLPDSGLIARRLADSPRLLCAAPAYLGREGHPATVADLQRHRFVGYANVPMGQSLRFRAPADREAAQLRVLPRLVVDSGEVMREAAVAGLGLVVLPRFLVVEALARGLLVEVLPDCPLVSDGVHFLCPAGREGAPAVRALAAALTAALGPVPPWERIRTDAG
jgi:DNA-binding transcriptional LysR family regulator